jgi:undecaprenyl-phosphate 4-deoxy-4-formamido-L-arabinose transferase
MREGYDCVGSIRKDRHDTAFRRWGSKAMNYVREHITHVKMTDQGCMLRAYSRPVIDAINSCEEVNTFIPALAYTLAQNPTEIEVAHEERHAGESKYSLYSLIRLNFDLMTNFSVVPLQVFSMTGIIISLLSAFFVVFLLIRRLIVGPEAEGLFTLFGIAFFLIGITLFGIGLLGEYVGRIYTQVRKRPRFLVRQVLGDRNRRTGEER